jgi:hypothetical protein
MLFRSLVDDDFTELNKVLDLVPVFLPVAIDQLKTGRKWNDIIVCEIEATKFIHKAKEFIDKEFIEALYIKLPIFEELDSTELKELLENSIKIKESIDELILNYYKEQTLIWTKNSDLHILQKKGLEKLANKLI